MIAAANLADPRAGHIADTTRRSTGGWVSDVCIADISAVVIDWLTTGKPVVVTRPVNAAARCPRRATSRAWNYSPKKRAGQIVGFSTA